jgi:hypothetical protein
MAAIVKEEPAPVAAAAPLVPPPLRWIIDRCLAKEPARRFASTAGLHEQLRDLRDHLTELSGGSGTRMQASPEPAPPPKKKRLPVALICVSAAIAGALLALWATPKPSRPAPFRYIPFATEAADEWQPAWSPDGTTLAYVVSVNDVYQVFTKGLGSSQAAQITRSQAACYSPLWSPDGSRIYYWSQGSLWSVGAAGGAPQVAIQDVARQQGPPAAISKDGKTFVFFRREGPQYALYIQSGAEKAIA